MTTRASPPHPPSASAPTPDPAPLRVALIGLGAIGRAVHAELARQSAERSAAQSTESTERSVARTAAQSAEQPAVELVAVLVRTLPPAAADSHQPASVPRGVVHPQPPALPLLTDRDALLALRPDLVVECAGHQAVDQHAEAILAAGIDLLLVSVGALADPQREARLRAAAAQPGAGRLAIAAGAVGGIDWLAAARGAGLDSVVYRSRKAPAAWAGTPAEARIDLHRLAEARTFFTGSAREAARLWPKNANVAATIALATLGLDDTRVELIADPAAAGNIHEVQASGQTGELQIRLTGRVDPDNPKTSTQTAWSVLREIRNRAGRWVI